MPFLPALLLCPRRTKADEIPDIGRLNEIDGAYAHRFHASPVLDAPEGFHASRKIRLIISEKGGNMNSKPSPMKINAMMNTRLKWTSRSLQEKWSSIHETSHPTTASVEIPLKGPAGG